MVKAHPGGVRVKADNLQALAEPARPASSAASTSAPQAGPHAATHLEEPRGGIKRKANDTAARGGATIGEMLSDRTVRVGLASRCIEGFMEALDADLYPDEAVERLFGIQMKPQTGKVLSDLSTWPIGNLTLGAWITIRNVHCDIKLKLYGLRDINDDDEERALQQEQQLVRRVRQEFASDITRAIVDGGLPQWYEDQLEGLREAGRASYYVLEILRRGCAGIPWDTQLLGRLAGKF